MVPRSHNRPRNGMRTESCGKTNSVPPLHGDGIRSSGDLSSSDVASRMGRTVLERTVRRAQTSDKGDSRRVQKHKRTQARRASRTVDCHLAKCDPPDQDSGTSAVSSLASSMNAVSAARTAPSLVANASTILLVGRSMSSAYHIVLLPLCQITGPPAELRS